MGRQFDYAAWRLQQCDDPVPMEKMLKHLEEDTVVGQQIAEARKLLDGDAKTKTAEAAQEAASS